MFSPLCRCGDTLLFVHPRCGRYRNVHEGGHNNQCGLSLGWVPRCATWPSAFQKKWKFDTLIYGRALFEKIGRLYSEANNFWTVCPILTCQIPLESSWSQLSESGICFSIRGGARRGRPFIDPPLSPTWRSQSWEPVLIFEWNRYIYTLKINSQS